MNDIAATQTAPNWPVSSRKRLLLAGYLDFLLFSAPWAVATWVAAQSLPGLKLASFPLKVVLFLTVEAMLLTLIKWSPGQFCLGIVAFKRSPFVSPDDPSVSKPSYLVEPSLIANERWWTVLFGVLTILGGAKSLVRWTMWHASLPVMGVELSQEMSIVAQIFFGVAEVFVGVAVLRLRFLALPVGLSLCAFELVSTFMSWHLLPGWVEEHVKSRRMYQGMAPRPGEIEFMQAVIPIATVVTVLVAAGWLLIVGRRLRKAKAA